MLIHEAAKSCGLTKKAIEYYVEKGLLSPHVSDNGYREFTKQDLETLQRIRVLRALGLPTQEIQAILHDDSGESLKRAALKEKLEAAQEEMRRRLLSELSEGRSYQDVAAALSSLEQNQSVASRLFHAFPGYYGRVICLHFARFLTGPIQSPKQQAAYERIIEFLDACPPLELPQELQAYLSEYTRQIGLADMENMLEQTKHSIENPDEFLSSNKEVLDEYLQYRQSDAYRASPAFALSKALKGFHQQSGYYDVFIPAMKALSPSYASYYEQLEAANEKLLAQYPEIAELNE